MEYMSNEINDIATALSKAQSTIVSATKDKQGYGYKYAELSTVQEVVKKPFAENGLSYTHIMQGSVLRCILMHTTGQWLASDYPIEAVASKNMNINQARGSAITYGRRYTLAGIAGIPQEDDDGQGSAPEYARPAPAPKTVKKEITPRQWVDVQKELIKGMSIADVDAYVAKNQKPLDKLYNSDNSLQAEIIQALGERKSVLKGAV